MPKDRRRFTYTWSGALTDNEGAPSLHDGKVCVLVAEVGEDESSGYALWRVRFRDGTEGIARDDELIETKVRWPSV